MCLTGKPGDGIRCKHCSSLHTIRFGHTKSGQRMYCLDCRHTFLANDAFAGMRIPSQVVISALTYLKLGASLNEVRNSLFDSYEIQPSRSSLLRWKERFKG